MKKRKIIKRIVIIAVVIVLVLTVGLFAMIGVGFMNTVKRPELSGAPMPMDISFYENSPHKAAAERGMAYMKTVPSEEVWIESYDGLKLHGEFFPAPNGDNSKIVLGIHGFRSAARHEYGPYIEFYHSLGYSMLLPDNRAHGQSEGDYMGLGILDRLDCISWADYLVDTYGQDVQILLHGVSMGGATVLSAAGEETLPEQVFGIVSDCGFTSMKEQTIDSLKKQGLPEFPFFNIVDFFCKTMAGYDLHSVTALEQVTKAKVPILFVQGMKDPFVTPENAQRLYDACASEKRLLLVDGAAHAESIAVAPEEYHQALIEFFDLKNR